MLSFPNINDANEEGILAVGGDLSPERLMLAYRSGIFPWFNKDEPIIWWSPDPRFVLFPDKLKVSKSMKKLLNENAFKVTFNQNFEEVIEHCATIKRNGQADTWITEEMREAYFQLYKLGFAKSVEVWNVDKLVGGLYGIDLGNVFCGESMFSLENNASKYGFIKWVQRLKQKNYQLIDCQVYTAHLESFGAEMIGRTEFISIIESEF